MRRATHDIDFGIAVESWTQFEFLKERLLATNDFSASRPQQRLTFADSNEGISIPVDLIPFRGVASTDGTVTWSPGRDIVMNVAGFEEALTSSVLIEIEAGLTVHVASVAGLTLLKLGRTEAAKAIKMPRTCTVCLLPTPTLETGSRL